MSRTLANGLLLTMAIIWGTTFVFQTIAMEYLRPYQFIAIRYAVGGLFVLPVIIFSKAKSQSLLQVMRTRKKLAILVILLGVWMFIGISLQQTALLYTSVANAGFLTSLYLPLVPCLSFIFLKKKSHQFIWFGVLLSLVGSWLMSESSSISGRYGDWLLILSAFFWALHILTIETISKQILAPFQISLFQSLMTVSLALIAALFFEGIPSISAILNAGTAILFSGIGGVALGFSFQIIAQRYVPASNATLIMASEAVFAALAGWMFLSQEMELLAIIGALLIIAAIILAEFGNIRK